MIRGTIKLDMLWIASKKNDPPFSPIAHIIPKTFSPSNYKNVDVNEGWPLLTPQCMTSRELDEQIDILIDDLETIRDAAGRKFRN